MVLQGLRERSELFGQYVAQTFCLHKIPCRVLKPIFLIIITYMLYADCYFKYVLFLILLLSFPDFFFLIMRICLRKLKTRSSQIKCKSIRNLQKK